MTRFRRILAIYNPVAGGGRQVCFERALEGLHAAGFEVILTKSKHAGDSEAAAVKARESNYDLIIAAGGDGTVNEIVNGLAGGTVPLAVFPLGTTNVLAAELGIDSTPRKFVRLLKEPKLATAWLGEINGRYFVLMASLGFDAHVVGGVSERVKKILGKGAYLARACRQWAACGASEYELALDGVSYRASTAVIAKGRYYAGRFIVCPASRITEERFYVCLMPSGRRSDLLRYGFALCRGTLHKQRDVQVIAASEIAISGPAGMPIQVDGDVRAKTPAVARIAPTPLIVVMGSSSPQG